MVRGKLFNRLKSYLATIYGNYSPPLNGSDERTIERERCAAKERFEAGACGMQNINELRLRCATTFSAVAYISAQPANSCGRALQVELALTLQDLRRSCFMGTSAESMSSNAFVFVACSK